MKAQIHPKTTAKKVSNTTKEWIESIFGGKNQLPEPLHFKKPKSFNKNAVAFCSRVRSSNIPLRGSRFVLSFFNKNDKVWPKKGDIFIGSIISRTTLDSVPGQKNGDACKSKVSHRHCHATRTRPIANRRKEGPGCWVFLENIVLWRYYCFTVLYWANYVRSGIRRVLEATIVAS